MKMKYSWCLPYTVRGTLQVRYKLKNDHIEKKVNEDIAILMFRLNEEVAERCQN